MFLHFVQKFKGFKLSWETIKKLMNMYFIRFLQKEKNNKSIKTASHDATL